MFERLGRLVVHNPWKVILAWLVAAVAIVALAPGLDEVRNQDQADFLPSDYESVQAMRVAEEKFARANDTTATVVVKRTDGQPLTGTDQAKLGELAQAISSAGIPGSPAWSDRRPRRRTTRSRWSPSACRG